MSDSTPDQDIITLVPSVRSGRPTIRGLRITVYEVLSYLAASMSHQDILEDFPSLTEQDIQACLAYAADRERQVRITHVRRCSSTGTSKATRSITPPKTRDRL